MDRRYKIALLDYDVFIDMIKGSNRGYATNLPKDAEIIRFRESVERNGIEIVIESKGFGRVHESCVIPNFEIKYTPWPSKTYTAIADAGPDCDSPLLSPELMEELEGSLNGIDPEMDESDDEPAGGFDTGRFIEESRRKYDSSLDYFRTKM